MRIVVTGGAGFIGKNLLFRLKEVGERDVHALTKSTEPHEFASELAEADFVFHLAGANRPEDQREFVTTNVGVTEALCAALAASGRRAPVVFASSVQAVLDSPYGRSKRAAEEVLLRHSKDTGAPVYPLRLPNVFGKWSRPEYNSVVATFCYRLARSLPITIHDATAPLRLLHVDDLVNVLTALLAAPVTSRDRVEVTPIYETTVGEVAGMLEAFAASRKSLLIPPVGNGLSRALYSTYISFLPPESFAYEVPRHADPRGVFVEMLKTPDCGQFSYFTARPGVTRGEHYHHTKTEKFLVIRGTARFCFRHIDTGETHELTTRGGEARIVETIPGWAHNIVNVGDDELVVLLWANEIFDRARPDTVAMKVGA
jgi:UDP-2-acetamido-2,6-beta-L-arabino-hexul-4-ose reductase